MRAVDRRRRPGDGEFAGGSVRGGATPAIAGAFGACTVRLTPWSTWWRLTSCLTRRHLNPGPAHRTRLRPSCPSGCKDWRPADTTVHAPAPEGLDRTANPLAAPCVLSIAGAAQVTMRLLPVPCAKVGAPGGFGQSASPVPTVVDAAAAGTDGWPARICVDCAHCVRGSGEVDARGRAPASCAG